MGLQVRDSTALRWLVRVPPPQLMQEGQSSREGAARTTHGIWTGRRARGDREWWSSAGGGELNSVTVSVN